LAEGLEGRGAPTAMERLKEKLPELALESIMIVFSVLLALAASSWADTRREHTLVEQARTSFVRELESNRARVAAAMPYHRALTAAVMEVDSVGGVRSYADWKHRVPIWSGFAPPDLTATAWQSALTTGVLARMPYRDVAVLSNAYTLQGKLDVFNTSYLPLFDFSDASMPGTVRRMRAYMQTVVVYEEAITSDYDSALAVLKSPARRR
jgi:hypothetical protein